MKGDLDGAYLLEPIIDLDPELVSLDKSLRLTVPGPENDGTLSRLHVEEMLRDAQQGVKDTVPVMLGEHIMHDTPYAELSEESGLSINQLKTRMSTMKTHFIVTRDDWT